MKAEGWKMKVKSKDNGDAGYLAPHRRSSVSLHP
jgi:hypothetical protein